MDFFCHKKPTQLAWSQIVIRGRPKQPQLTGGTIVVRNAASQAVLQTIQVTSSDIYSISSIAYASNPRLTIEFTPTYSGGAAVGPYALEVQFTADQPPQVCYQARVDSCGHVFNTATFCPAEPAPDDETDRSAPPTRRCAAARLRSRATAPSRARTSSRSCRRSRW